MPGEFGGTMVRTLARGSPAEIPRTIPNELNAVVKEHQKRIIRNIPYPYSAN